MRSCIKTEYKYTTLYIVHPLLERGGISYIYIYTIASYIYIYYYYIYIRYIAMCPILTQYTFKYTSGSYSSHMIMIIIES